MKTLSILLVMVGVTLAKPPTRFPDFLAPFRTMFGGSSSSRGSQQQHHQPQQQHVEKVPYYASTHSDPTIADTKQNNNPYAQSQGQSAHGQSNNDDGFFPSSFPSYESDGGFPSSYNDVEPQYQSERRPSHFGGGGRPPPPQFHHHQSEPPPISSTYGAPDGRPPPKFHHQSEERHPPPQYNPPPKFHLHHSENRPPPPQFGPPDGRPPKFHLHHSEERSPSSQHGSSWEGGPPSPPKFPSEGRPPPHFHKRPKHQHRPHHFPSNQQRAHDFPAPSFQNNQVSHLTHMQDFPTQPQGQSQHHRPSFPEHGGSFNQLHQHQRPAGSGFTDFNFNPADFDRGHFMIGGGEQKPSESPRHFNPSKPIPFGDGPPGPQQPGDAPFGKGGGGGGPDIITLADVEKGMKGRQNEVYFDDVYRQPPQGHRANQREDPMKMSPMAVMRSHKSSSEEVGVKKMPNSSPMEMGMMGDVHYGKPMTMSGSSNKPTVLKNHGRKYKKPYLLKSPTIQPPKEPLEPLSMAASGHGGGLENYGEGSGDRILYHVSGHQGPYSYRYGFDTGAGYNRMFRHEEKDGSGIVKGKYGYHDKNGKLQVVNYSAHPTGGFHAERQH